MIRDTDVEGMTRVRLKEEVMILRGCIRKHRDSWVRGDDKCWKDNVDLYQVLPEGFKLPPMDSTCELANCVKYIESCHHPDIKYVSPQIRIEELEAEVGRLKDSLKREMNARTAVENLLDKTKKGEEPLSW